MTATATKARNSYRTAAQAVQGNEPLEAYRLLLLRVAAGEAKLPGDYELEQIAQAAGRSIEAFNGTLELAQMRYHLAGIQNERRRIPELKRTAHAAIKKEIEELRKESTVLRGSQDANEANIQRLEQIPAKVERWKKEYLALAPDKRLTRDHNNRWPPWCAGQELSGRTVGFEDIDSDLVYAAIADELAKMDEISRLRESIEGYAKQIRRLWERINELERLMLDWRAFAF